MNRLLLLVLAGCVAGCFPSFEDRPWLVDEARVIGIRGTPAEARPSETVTFEAIVASPTGTLSLPVEWSFCLAPRSVEERTGVTASCANGNDLSPVTNPGTVIADACSRFGPNPPPTSDGDPPLRPADPDPSGGYYVPVRALVTDPATGNDVVSFGFQRVRCDLAGATRAIFEEFQDRYTNNVNPGIAGAYVVDAAGSQQDVAGGVVVAPGSTATIRVVPAADASESYIVYEAENGLLRDHVETLTASWTVSAGQLSRARATLSEEEVAGGVLETTWTAPTAPGPASMWIVVRDARGGSAWLDVTVSVQ